MDDDLFLMVVLSFLTVLVIFVDGFVNLGFLRVVLGLVYILFIPGYSLIGALFPSNDDLDNIERIALSFGVSIAVVPLIGLGLNYTPWGIRLTPIVISLTIFVLIFCVVAHYRRKVLPKDERFYFKFSSIEIELFQEDESKLDKALTIILIISILASVIALIYVVQMPKRGEKFTEFYVLGPDGKAANYPEKLNVGEEATIILGAQNHEYQTVNYTTVIYPTTNNNTLTKNDTFNKPINPINWENRVNSISLEPNTAYGGQITLNHEEKWGEHITGNATGKLLNLSFQETGNYKLQFLLIRDNEVYRELHLWIDVER